MALRSSSSQGSNSTFNTVTGTSGVDSQGFMRAGITTRTTSGTLTTSSQYTQLIDATSGNLTITLPTASTATRQLFAIKKIDASANTVTIDGNGSLIDGTSTKVISTQWTCLMLHCNGTSWYILSVN